MFSTQIHPRTGIADEDLEERHAANGIANV